MRKILFAGIAMLIFNLGCFGQFTENFNDGDFTNNPAWSGGTGDWVVNPSFQLQSNNTVANSTFYLSTASTKATTAQWEFFIQLTFNTSSANYVDVFLIADAGDLTQSTTSGYFVRLGGTADEICLYRKDGATSIKIIDGADAVLNSSNNSVHIKVVRDATNNWTLSQQTNTAPNIVEGTVTDATYLTSSFFGILVKQSTASFFQRHYIDDIVVSDYVPDLTAPVIQSVTATGINTLDVLFDEPVEQLSSEQVTNYVVDNGIGSPATANRDLVNTALVHLVFANNFPIRTNLQITINGVNDIAGNTATNLIGIFSYFIPIQYDVVMDELMADPDPQIGLPNVEWLELKNISGFDIDLAGWTLAKPSGTSGAMPSYLLKKDSFVIVCTGSAVAAMSAFGPAISVTSFPSLGNDGDLLYLVSPQGSTIHSVIYTSAWYQNTVKADGGWSLEMMDTHNPCSGISNWKASENLSGGTPGKRNSIDGSNPDQTAPQLLRAYAVDNFNITLIFDEPISTVNAAVTANYTVSDGIGNPVSATAVAPAYNSIQLVLANALQPGKVYTVTAAPGITDCGNNSVAGIKNTARVGLAEITVDSFDIVINEILFNPKPTSNDYVEIYNRSNKILDLKNVSIANASGFTHLSTETYLFFPGDFMVITNSRDLVLHDYVANDLYAFIEVSTPSYNDDAGDVLLLNEQGKIIDEVKYLDDWHFPLIHDEEGVSLERIDYNAPSQNAANWHSAATNVGYGTPTYKNSQFRLDGGVSGQVSVEPEIFSPDNDGRDDFATINYNFPEPGYVANISIFDAVGRKVRNLQRNALCGVKGYFRWDGLDEKNQKLPVGIYIIYTEVFNLAGKTKKFKHTIVLAKKQ
ncbi:MAG: lamin tail domain-containing protein [Bacteroidetes bacterium]|nr:lamin tail domain-containing protein [Bacteroidota bacterium]